MLRLILFIGLLTCQLAMAQNPVANFSNVATACSDQWVEFINGSTDADRYEWDFCANDFENLSSNAQVAPITGLLEGFGYRLVEDNGFWYGFAVSQGGSKLMRLEFGDSPLNTPTITDLGTLGNQLIFPHEIDLIKHNGQWYGFITSNEDGFGVVRADFGTSLTNVPTATNVGAFGVSGRIWDVRIVKQNGDLILVMDERNEGKIVRVNFRDSFDNPIDPGTHVFNTGSLVPGGNQSPGFELIHRNNEWIALVASRYNSGILQVNFGSDLLGAHAVDATYFLAGVNNPFRLSATQEGDDFYVLVSNDPNAAPNNPVQLINFKDLTVANPPVPVNFPSLPELIGIDLIKFQGKGIAHGVGLADNNLNQMVFEAACDATLNYFVGETPALVAYGSMGDKKIELKVSHSQVPGFVSIKTGSVAVSALTSPDIEISTNGNVCVSHPIQFTPHNISNDIVGYNWDFGDTQGSTDVNPEHTYASKGAFNIRVTVEASNGCFNTAGISHETFLPPQAQFENPDAPMYCTNQLYQFQNTSVIDPDLPPTWEWKLDGVVVSDQMTFSQMFLNATTAEIRLKASLPGCESENVNTITLNTGPVTDFLKIGECVGSAIQFQNLSEGEIESFEWDFGTEGTSALASPTVTFTSPGIYLVSLHSNAVNGCNTSVEKEIQVFSLPQPDFIIDLPPFSCSGTPSQFHDLSPVPDDSNLETWNWNFSEGAEGAGQNPAHTFATAGDFNVSLTVTSDRGCSASVTKPVTIFQTPEVAFNFDAACINQVVHFEDQTAGPAKDWQWKIANSTYTSQSIAHVFLTTGSFVTTLQVTASNDCVGSTTKNVVVPNVPSIDFEMTNPCEGQEAVFTDKSTSQNDPVLQSTWVFDDLMVTGSGVSHSFDESGTYPVGLKIKNTSGCEYEIVKNVTIYPAPSAAFNLSVDSGPPPLQVQFENTSTGALSYRWLSNGSPQATTENLEMNFTDVGDYIIDLYAVSDHGCESQTSNEVHVIIPRTDLSLMQFNFLEDPLSGSLRNQLVIANNSNYTIRQFDVLLDLGNGSVVREQVKHEIKSGESQIVLLNNSLQRVAAGYVCVELLAPNDVTNNDNRLCNSLAENSVLFNPSPNPADDFIAIEWVAPAPAMASVNLINAVGEKVSTWQVETNKGLNSYSFDVSQLQPGIYLLTLEVGGEKQIHRILIR